MRNSSTLIAFALFIPAAGFSEESSSGSAAKIQFEIDKAKSEVDKKYGGKPEKELTREERTEKARAESDAANAVLESHGMDAKSFTSQRAKMGKDADPASVKSGAADQDFSNQVKDLKKKDEEAKAKKPEEPPAIVVEKGPIVEKGIAAQDELETGSAAEIKVQPGTPQSKGAAEGGKSE